MGEAKNSKFFERERESRGESSKAIVVEMESGDSVGKDVQGKEGRGG